MPISAPLKNLIEQELAVDRIEDDVTTRLVVSKDRMARAIVRSREAGVFHGAQVVGAFQTILGGGARFKLLQPDGYTIKPGDALVELEAQATLCLVVERSLINFLAHLSGIASLTRKYVEQVGAANTKILATRKTLPGLRDEQLAAVRSGGGWVHRRSLSDGILIKDNHQELMAPEAILGEAQKQHSPLHRIELEVQSLEVLKRLLANVPKLPDVIMLDNLKLDEVQEAIRLINGRAAIEVSGGIKLENVGALAALGVDYISVGRITHSAPSLDLTLDIQWAAN